MAVGSGIPYNLHTGTGVATTFGYTFTLLDAADLVVRVDGAVTTGYAVIGVGVPSGGSVVFSSPPAAGVSVELLRVVGLTRATDYQNNGDLLAPTLNADFDRLWMAVQGVSYSNDATVRAPSPEQLNALPTASERALRLLAFDAAGQPLVIPGVDAGSASALALDLASSAGATKGAGQVGYGAALAYSAGTIGLQLRQRINLAAWPGVDPTGATECGAAIRLAMAEAASSGRPLVWNSGTYVVGPDPAAPTASGFRTYSLLVPSNAVWIFEGGATIKQANGVQSWCRTVSMEGASNVRIYGEMRVDANVANAGASTNEHMHGVFLYNTTETYIERIDSRNARGDNVFIGGDDETTHSKNVYIGSIRAVKAGRKSFVLQHFDAIAVGRLDCDQTNGGAAAYGGVADTTDRHCIDLEPDTATGAAWMRASIGTVTTVGTGNDFTAGTTDAVARKVVLTIDELTHTHISSGTVPAWEQNACTVHVGVLRMTGLAGISGAMLLNYAAYLHVGEAYLSGTTPTVSDPMILMAANGANRSRATFGALHLVNTVGAGIENRDAGLRIGRFRAETAGIALWSRGTSSTAGVLADTIVEDMEMADVGQPAGAGYAVLHSMSGSNVPVLTVQRILFADSRTPKLNYIISCGAGAAAGLTVGAIDNTTSVVPIQWAGSDKFARLMGGGGLPGDYVCQGTPESMVAAPIGSTARRLDGGAGTSFYVKQTGTGSTGWVGK